MYGNEHFIRLRLIVQRLIFITKPEQFLLSISSADILTQINQTVINHLMHSIRFHLVRSTFNRHCPLIIRITGSTPGTILLFHIQSDPAIPIDSIIRRSLGRRFMKPVPQTFCCTLTYYTVRRYSVNLLRSQSGMIRTEQRVCYQITITVPHNHSPSSSSSNASSGAPSLLSCSCSSTSFIFCGIGSPRCPAFSNKLTPSLEI